MEYRGRLFGKIAGKYLEVSHTSEFSKMNFLVTTDTEPPFFTDWFTSENIFNAEVGMVVYNLRNNTYTTDGMIWNCIETDHL